ncbi:MAG: tetratricopeptide repeat protein, partial [bacterium]|nr:tetratricopeptide repeat protein [bacterium]
MKKNKDYQRLLSFAVGFKNRFALLLARSSFLDIREKWLKQLNCDLKEERIHVVHIHGDSWEKNSEKSITAFIRKHIPASRRYILSLSRFDYHMLPKFPENLKGKDLLSESYSPIPSPSSFIRRLNFERDAIIKAFPVPVIFWLSQAAVRQIAEYAPDFYDFRKFIIDLPQPTRLKHRPSIQATSFIKITKPEVLSPETYRTLEIKLAGLRSLERDTDKGRRFINILKDLAFSKYVPGKWEDGLNLLREGFAEALRLNMQDEQAHMKKQLAFFYYNMDRKTVALQLWEEAIEIYRKLVAKSAYLYLPTLVEALNFKAILLAELGRPLAAKIEFNETLRLARKLFEKEPEVRSPIMAEVLNNYALFLTELKKLKEAEGIFKEAIALYRGLSNNKYRISLALVLNNFGNLMVSTTRLDAAFPLHQEALHLRRLLFTANPGLYRAQLCQSLYNLALL